MKGPADVAHGPMFIGFTINVILYGIMITQVYIYFANYKKDRTWIKLFVLLLFLCDTVNSVFDAVYLYGSLVTHFGDPQYLGKADWVFVTDPVMTAIIAILVQGFFAWRIRVLTGNVWLVIMVLVFSVAGFVGGVATSFEVVRIPEFINFREFKWAVIMWLLGACCADIVITIILVLHLRRHKTGFQASDDIVDRVIRLTVQTGLVTAVCATIDLALFLADPSGMHLIFNFPLSKLYTNTLMSSLNSRGAWNLKGPQAQYANTEGVGTTTRPGTLKSNHRSTLKMHEYDQGIPCSRVFVHVESHEMRDNETPLTAHTSISRPETRGSQAEEKEITVESQFNSNDRDGDRVVDLPTAMLGINKNRNASNERVPFQAYQTQRGDYCL